MAADVFLIYHLRSFIMNSCQTHARGDKMQGINKRGDVCIRRVDFTAFSCLFVPNSHVSFFFSVSVSLSCKSCAIELSDEWSLSSHCMLAWHGD